MGKEIQQVNSERQRQKFSKEFKLNAVRLLQAGQKPATQLALELGIRRNLLYKWAETLSAHQGNIEAVFNGPGHGKLGKQHNPLKAENTRLKHELARITEERDILKKPKRISPRCANEIRFYTAADTMVGENRVHGA